MTDDLKNKLQFYNARTRRKDIFVPLDQGGRRVSLYVCGPTVYDRPHLGNARSAVVFDVLARLLAYVGYEVNFVRNVTDVDDKINAAAAERGIPIRELTEATLKLYHDDIGALGVRPPTIEPRVTDSIDNIIAMIARLIAVGAAYEAKNHVLFDVTSDAEYGTLSGRSLKDMIAGSRVEIAPYKKNPADFVLWKPSPPELPGWDSPWGRGRPGWHIECSAMIEKHLGTTIDIHGGGNDLLFPHHENEAAQSRCAHSGAPLANFWLHNGMLTVDGKKMSKSEGNFVTVQDFLERGVSPETIRFAMLKTHYRQPLDWTNAFLDESMSNRHLLNNSYTRAVHYTEKFSDKKVNPSNKEMAFLDSMKNDLNTPDAINDLIVLAYLVMERIPHYEEVHNYYYDEIVFKDTIHYLEAAELSKKILGLTIKKLYYTTPPNDVRILEKKRDEARKSRQFTEADRLRDEIAVRGWGVKDQIGTSELYPLD